MHSCVPFAGLISWHCPVSCCLANGSFMCFFKKIAQKPVMNNVDCAVQIKFLLRVISVKSKSLLVAVVYCTPPIFLR